jgi:hypothetical protein
MLYGAWRSVIQYRHVPFVVRLMKRTLLAVGVAVLISMMYVPMVNTVWYRGANRSGTDRTSW